MTASPETCWTLVRSAASGDVSARAQFSHRYVTPVRTYLARRWNNSPMVRELDDATQEVFVECYKSGGVLERADARHGDFRALLFAVARKVAQRFERRAAESWMRRPQDSVWLETLPAREDELAAAFDRAWARALMRTATRLCAHRARASGTAARRRFRILKLRTQQGLPIRAIAARWELEDVEALHQEYRRARREFHACLREVVESHCAAGANVDAECRALIELLG